MARPGERDAALPPLLAQELARVPTLHAAYEPRAMMLPIRGSRCWEDRLLGVLGERPGATASTKLAVAFDHADLVRRLLMEVKTLPVWAHLTLVRPVFETCVQVRWLLEPNSPRERVGRAVGAALSDLRWRAMIEADMRGIGWTPSASAQSGTDRSAEVARQAADAGIPAATMPDTTRLLRHFGLIPGRSQSYLFRFTSGVAHAQIWAALSGDVEQYHGETFSWQSYEANTDLTASILVAAVRHLELAGSAFVAYHEPAAPVVATDG